MKALLYALVSLFSMACAAISPLVNADVESAVTLLPQANLSLLTPGTR